MKSLWFIAAAIGCSAPRWQCCGSWVPPFLKPCYKLLGCSTRVFLFISSNLWRSYVSRKKRHSRHSTSLDPQQYTKILPFTVIHVVILSWQGCYVYREHFYLNMCVCHHWYGVLSRHTSAARGRPPDIFSIVIHHATGPALANHSAATRTWCDAN